MFRQGVYPIQYEEEKGVQELTQRAGLPLYLELADVSGLLRAVQKYIRVRENSQGWTDAQVIGSLILLNVAGGESVDDLKILEADRGLCRILRRAPLYRIPLPHAPEYKRRWPKGRKRTFPSPSAIFRYLPAFHDAEQEKLRKAHKAFIPHPNKHLRAFRYVNRDFISFVQSKNPQSTATLDTDATLIATYKSSAFYCYKGFLAYQPLNVWWAEQQMVLLTEFRDGNVPAGYQQLRIFKEALQCLPNGVRKVRLRSDTAGYQHELLSYCESGKAPRFGRIEFTVSCDVTPSFKEAVSEVAEEDWHPIYEENEGMRIKTSREWAEVCYVPQEMGLCKNSPVYRYLAIREPFQGRQKPSTSKETKELPFQTIELQKVTYKLFGKVTNMDWEGEKLIKWHNKRCGKSEEAHSIMKEDLAGGRLPSSDFGENAAWWWIMILALNLNSAFKGLVLGKEWLPRRMKALRFRLLNVAARVIERGRQLFVRLQESPAFQLLLDARRKILALAYGPSP